MTAETTAPADFDAGQVGARIRALRIERKLTLRDMAEQLGISVSALSQVERGRMRPSVTRLYQIVSLLEVPLDAVFGAAPQPAPAPSAKEAVNLPAVAVQRAGEQPLIELEQGITWRRINPHPLPGVEILEVTYPPGSVSTPNGEFLRHSGREVAQVTTGRLQVEVGFESYDLGPGDSLMFDSSAPHRITNVTEEETVALWVTLARLADG